MNNFDCPEACNGLFADVRIEKDELLDQSSDFKSIVEEYVKYKENYVQNIEFNSGFVNKSFGEFNQWKNIKENSRSSERQRPLRPDLGPDLLRHSLVRRDRAGQEGNL